MFPALSEVHRTTFCHQAANLGKTKEELWQEFLALTLRDPTFATCDSTPLPVCCSLVLTAALALKERPPRSLLPLHSCSYKSKLEAGREPVVGLPCKTLAARALARQTVADGGEIELAIKIATGSSEPQG